MFMKAMDLFIVQWGHHVFDDYINNCLLLWTFTDIWFILSSVLLFLLFT